MDLKMANIFNIFNLVEGDLGKEVSLNAMLIITNCDCYLVPKGEDDTSHNRIEIYFPNLEVLLDKAVGGWVGSNVIYFDEIIVKGILNKGTTLKKPLSINGIIDFSLIRDEEEYKIL